MILTLSVGAVLVTTAGVGWVVHPDGPGHLLADRLLRSARWWRLPDAVAATAIARNIGLPRRVVTILEGESLFNDATALVTLRIAIAAARSASSCGVSASTSSSRPSGRADRCPAFVVVAQMRRRITDPVLDVGLSFVIPFACFLVAEGSTPPGSSRSWSPACLWATRRRSCRPPSRGSPSASTGARSRSSSRTRSSRSSACRRSGCCGTSPTARSPGPGSSRSALATLVAVIVLRLVCVFLSRWFLVRPGPDPVTGRRPPLAQTFIVGWAGMRGVVTLAAAFIIPPETDHVEVLVVIAFTVVAGTLLIQGCRCRGSHASCTCRRRTRSTTHWLAPPCCSRRRRPRSRSSRSWRAPRTSRTTTRPASTS